MGKYQSYKPSGVDWIGEIPEHWENCRLKHISKSVNGYSFKSDDFDREYDIPVIRIGDVGDTIDFNNCVKVKSKFLEEKKDFIVRKDDILIGLTGGTIGKSGKYNYDSPSLLNQRVGLLRNKSNVLNGLLYHYVKSEVFIRYIFYDCYGGGQDNISMNDILNMVFPLPPLSEQHQIVQFLDKKTELIDKLISTKERKITLLKEQRTSLINQVVTKGLNPNVKMKDTGVEWIGEIPEHWKKCRLKNISTSVNGYSFKSDDFDREYDIPVIRIGDVGDTIDFNNCVKVKSKFLEEKKDFIVRKDDILIGLTGGTIGKSGKYNYDFPSLLNQRVGLLRNSKEVLNGLLYFYIKSEVFIRYIFYDCYGGGQDNISMNDILNMVFPLPPVQEQSQLVEHLHYKTKEIDDLVHLEQKKIDLLKEYRQSLISEVVTGKIKVTNDE